MNELIPFGVIIVLALLIPEITFKIKMTEVPLLIIAGIIIGPYGLGIITNHIGLDFLASIGFLFLVFLAGLEIKGAKVPNKSIKLAVISAMICFISGFTIAWFFNYPFQTALLVGAIFQSSSVGEIIPIVNATKSLKEKMGSIIIPAIVIMDTISLIALSVILKINFAMQEIILFIILLAIFVYVMAILLPKIGTWINNRYKRGHKHVRLKYVLVILFVSIAISEIIGLHMIVAAFITGLFLGKTFKSIKIVNKLNVLAYGFFIPIFFIVIGLDTNIWIIGESLTYVSLTIAIILTLMLSKIIGAIIYSKANKMKVKEGFGLGVLLWPQLGATLAATTVGVEMGLIDEPLFVSIVTMSIVTALLTPFIIRCVYGNKNIRLDIKDHTIILGGGIVGEHAASALHSLNENFVIIEKSSERVFILRESGYDVIHGDSTDQDILRQANIEKAKLILVLLQEGRPTVIAVKQIKKLNKDAYIIARVHSEKERKILEPIVDDALYPKMIFGLNIMWHVVQWMKKTAGDNEIIADFPSNPPIFPYELKEDDIEEEDNIEEDDIEDYDDNNETEQ